MLIRKSAVLGWLTFIFCSTVWAEADAAKLSVDVIGLRIARPNTLKERVVWPAGTTLSLQVVSSAGDLLHFDPVDSVVSKFVDDKGTDLQARPEHPTLDQMTPAKFGLLPTVSKDAKSCALEFFAPNLPTRGASHLSVSGLISMYCATQKKETVIENVALKNGTKIAGPNNLELEIAEMNEAPRDIGREAMNCVFRAHRELDDVAEIKFFRPDGSEVKATRTSASILSIQGAVKVDWTYTFTERLDVGTVKLYTWVDIQKKRVKLDLTVDLGL